MKILVVTRVWSFIDDTIDEWKKRGDTVYKSPVYEPELAKKVDIIFFEFVDQQLGRCTQCPVGSKKRIFARLHRIEYYMNLIRRCGADWSKVEALIVTGEYYYNKIMTGSDHDILFPKTRVLHIKYGVDDGRYTFRDRQID